MLRGRLNFSSLARHNKLNEKTFCRGLNKDFDFETTRVGQTVFGYIKAMYPVISIQSW